MPIAEFSNAARHRLSVCWCASVVRRGWVLQAMAIRQPKIHASRGGIRLRSLKPFSPQWVCRHSRTQTGEPSAGQDSRSRLKILPPEPHYQPTILDCQENTPPPGGFLPGKCRTRRSLFSGASGVLGPASLSRALISAISAVRTTSLA